MFGNLQQETVYQLAISNECEKSFVISNPTALFM
jgi:hypothetical protein